MAANIKHFTFGDVAIKATLIGLGQAGGRMVNEFAKVRNANNKAVYNCLALNSNEGDLKELTHILPSDQHCLSSLGGFGKDPQRALEILDSNEKIRKELTDFVTKRMRQDDDMVIFFAGFGGGTGTSTLLKAVEDFYETHSKPILNKKLQEIRKEVGEKEFRENATAYKIEANEEASHELIKIGIVVAEPLRSDGPAVLSQVNEFNKKIWKLANDPFKGISFITFLDNQRFYEEFESLTGDERKSLNIDNFRDYGNRKFAQIFHELNTATTVGGTSVVFDKQDFKRLVMEKKGCLVINKVSKPMDKILNEQDLSAMFAETIKHSAFHEDLELIREEVDEDGNKKKVASVVHHVGMLAVLAKDKEMSSSFIDKAKISVSEEVPMTGTLFSGYITGYNDFQASTYTLFKTAALPRRLQVGLVEEFEEFRSKFRKYEIQKGDITEIGDLSFGTEDSFEVESFGFEESSKKKRRQRAIEQAALVKSDDEDLFGEKVDLMELEF